MTVMQRNFLLTLTAAIMDYYFQINELDIPEWIRDKRFFLKYPTTTKEID